MVNFGGKTHLPKHLVVSCVSENVYKKFKMIKPDATSTKYLLYSRWYEEQEKAGQALKHAIESVNAEAFVKFVELHQPKGKFDEDLFALIRSVVKGEVDVSTPTVEAKEDVTAEATTANIMTTAQSGAISAIPSRAHWLARARVLMGENPPGCPSQERTPQMQRFLNERARRNPPRPFPVPSPERTVEQKRQKRKLEMTRLGLDFLLPTCIE
jgi:hypothetical protein